MYTPETKSERIQRIIALSFTIATLVGLLVFHLLAATAKGAEPQPVQTGKPAPVIPIQRPTATKPPMAPTENPPVSTLTPYQQAETKKVANMLQEGRLLLEQNTRMTKEEKVMALNRLTIQAQKALETILANPNPKPAVKPPGKPAANPNPTPAK